MYGIRRCYRKHAGRTTWISGLFLEFPRQTRVWWAQQNILEILNPQARVAGKGTFAQSFMV
jgi:hypothetical protein